MNLYMTGEKPQLESDIRIVLIDDDPAVNFLHKTFISHEYPENPILIFTNPEEALRSLEDSGCEKTVLFLDINMPVLDGWQFLDGLTHKGMSCPVVMLTSSIADSDREKAFEYKQVIDYKIKPFRKQGLYESLARVQATD